MVGTAIRSRILGTGHYLPAKVVTNADLEKMVDTSDDWIATRTGIRQRHIAAPDEASSDMATKAAEHALEAAGIAADRPRPDHHRDGQRRTCSCRRPRCSCSATSARARTVPGFDLAAACAGFIYGLSIADAYVRTGMARHVLVVGVELLSRIVDWTDRNTCVLFGDGAGAVDRRAFGRSRARHPVDAPLCRRLADRVAVHPGRRHAHADHARAGRSSASTSCT